MRLKKDVFVLKIDSCNDTPLMVFTVPTSEVEKENLLEANIVANYYSQQLVRIELTECGSVGDMIKKIKNMSGD